jgi:hypothetical protein
MSCALRQPQRDKYQGEFRLMIVRLSLSKSDGTEDHESHFLHRFGKLSVTNIKVGLS